MPLELSTNIGEIQQQKRWIEEARRRGEPIPEGLYFVGLASIEVRISSHEFGCWWALSCEDGDLFGATCTASDMWLEMYLFYISSF